MKIAVLWSQLSGYLNVSLRALASKPGVELYVANQAAGPTAPFSSVNFDWLPRRYEYIDAPDSATISRDLDLFRPDILLASWHIRAFQKCSMQLRSRTVRVGCADNQWRYNLRQYLASLTAPFHLRRFYDAMFVPGERQVEWARHMGFSSAYIWSGLYTADVDSFGAAGKERSADNPAFLFVGRLTPEKGIATLAKAYEGYAAAQSALGTKPSDQPWKCLVAGTGPLDYLLSHPGFVRLGFVQPEAMPQLFAQAACFVLPSLEENWGVVLHEAAASGLPIVCTGECGASANLVYADYNGLVVDAGSVDQLQAAMTQMSGFTPEIRRAMADTSRRFAQKFTPDLWAETILRRGKELQIQLKIKW